jgi:hypothetical protein
MLEIHQVQSAMQKYIGVESIIRRNEAKPMTITLESVDEVTRVSDIPSEYQPSPRIVEGKTQRKRPACLSFVLDSGQKLYLVAQDFEMTLLFDGTHFTSQLFHIIFSTKDEYDIFLSMNPPQEQEHELFYDSDQDE